jgi:hypothetical protein
MPHHFHVSEELIWRSLPATPACEDLPLLRSTPAALAQFNG